MSPAARRWTFGPFTLDAANACLWRGTEAVALSPKAFDVLYYLVQHANRLVTKDELLDAVWPETAVTDAVVRVAIGTLRKALDDTLPPCFIATVPRRGYRLLIPVTMAETAESTELLHSPQATLPPPLSPLLVGRDAMLQRLSEVWNQARQGQRQVVWVTGEAGIGKTTVVEAFCTVVAADPTVWLAAGQCIEHYGTGEAYLPVLEALGQLCRRPGGERLVALLQQHAPTWMVQMPWLLTAAHRQQLRDELQGVTRERMLREFAEVVDALTVDTPLVLILEDLHWSDYATLDLLALLARRRAPARLCIVGTYRPVEAIVHHHPLRSVVQDLQRHGQATELPLALLSAAEIAAYLVARFPRQQFPAVFAPWLHQRTDGHPLFLVTLVPALVEWGVLYAYDGCWTVQEGLETLALNVPESLRQLIEQQIIRLSLADQRVLEVASVAGVEFAAAVVAAGLNTDDTMVEEHCEALVGQQLLRPLGVMTWPNGTVVTRYAFVHALYQQVVYERLGAGQRVRLHQRLGECLETAYGTRVDEVAAELAEHFVRSQDAGRAALYLRQTAENAIHRYAYTEAISHLTRGLELLTTMPETLERLQLELDLQVPLGATWAQIRGWATPESGQAYARARVLCERLGASLRLPVVLLGQFFWYGQRAEWQMAYELAESILTLAHHQADPILLVSAHFVFGAALLCRGEVAVAHTHLTQGSALYVPPYHLPLVARNGIDLGVAVRCFTASSLWLLGQPEQTLAQMHEAYTLAQVLAHPYSLTYAQQQMMRLHQWQRDALAVRTWAEALMALSAEHGFGQYGSQGMLLYGWALMAQGEEETGLDQMRQSLTAYESTGAAIWRPYYLTLLAEGYGRVGATEEALQVLAEALSGVQKTGERVWEAELHRLTGALLLQQTAPDERRAETCFHQALTIAHRQQAKSLELRAATSLARLWQQQGKGAKAYPLLAELYGWFTEGFETVDLREAKALLDELAHAQGG